jgi:glycosyltransferase involved in cell wall biosynthesis
MSRYVSIITPCFNSESTLERTIKSVFEQEYSKFELILVDDGSSDGTKAIIERYVALDSRVKAIFLDHVGVSKARNQGVTESVSDIIAFLDSDDIFYKSSLSERIKTFCEYESSDKFLGVYCPAKKILLNNKSMGLAESAFKSDGGFALHFGDTFKSPFVPSQVILKKSKFIDVGGFKIDSGLCEDYYLWQELMMNEHYFLLSEKTSIGYTQRKESVVHRRPYEHFVAFDEALKFTLGIDGQESSLARNLYKLEIKKRAVYSLVLLLALGDKQGVEKIIKFFDRDIPFQIFSPSHLANMFKSACIRVIEGNARQWDTIKKLKQSELDDLEKLMRLNLNLSESYINEFLGELSKSSVQLGRFQKAMSYYNKLSWHNKMFLLKLGVIYTLGVSIFVGIGVKLCTQ